MGIKYSHFSNSERWAIESKIKDGLSFAAIGRSLGRHRSSIMRESRRGIFPGFDRYLAEFGRRYYWQLRVQAGHCRRKLDSEMLKPAPDQQDDSAARMARSGWG